MRESFEPGADRVVVRPGSERDFASIARIQNRCPETAQWPLGDYSGYPLIVALIEGTVAGFCSWRQTTGDEAELLNIAVDPSFRRRGAGSALLQELLRQATGLIFLEVAEPNAPAIALYSKHGWEPAGSRRGYYNDGTVNAVVMKKRSW